MRTSKKKEPNTIDDIIKILQHQKSIEKINKDILNILMGRIEHLEDRVYKLEGYDKIAPNHYVKRT